MAKHATLLDAFNASARVVEQGTDFLDSLNREQAELEAQNEALNLTRESNLFLQSLQTTGDSDDLLRQFEEFHKGYEASVEKRARGIRASPLFRRTMEGMLKDNRVRMEAKVRGRQIELTRENNRAKLFENIELSWTNNVNTPELFLPELQNLLRTGIKTGTISYPDALQIKTERYNKIVNNYIDQSILKDFEKGIKPEDIDIGNIDLSIFQDFSLTPIRNEDDKFYAQTLRAKLSLTADEAAWLREFDARPQDDTEGYEEKLELSSRRNDALREAGKQRVPELYQRWIVPQQKETAAEASITYNEAQLAVALGKPEARELVMKGIEKLNAYPQHLLTEDTGNKYNRWYVNLLKELDAGPGNAAARAAHIKDVALSGKLKELLTEVAAGRGGEFGSLYDFSQGCKGVLYTWAVESGNYSGTQKEFEDEYVHIFEQYWDFARDVAKDSPEALSAINVTKGYFDSLDGANPQNAKFMDKKYEGVSGHARGQVMSMIWDEIWAYDNRNPKDAGLRLFEKVTEMLGVISGETVRAFNETSEKGDAVNIELVKTLENKSLMHTDNEGRQIITPGPVDDPYMVQRGVQNAWNVLGNRIAGAEGLDPDKLVAHPTEDYWNYEKDASPEFQYDGGSTWFRLRVQGTDRNERLILERRDGKDGAWGNPRVLDSEAEDEAATRAFRQVERSRNTEVETDNREASRLAGLSLDRQGTLLPMPDEYRGRDDDTMSRHEFISRYGVGRYKQFLEEYYRKAGQPLPEAIR